MIFTRRFMLLLGLGIAPFLLVWWLAGSPSTARATLLTYDLLLLLLAFLDLRRAEDVTSWRVERILPHRFMLGVENPVLIRVQTTTPRPLTIEIRDEYPPELDLRGERTMIAATSLHDAAAPLGSDRLTGQVGLAEAGYHLHAGNRGDYHFGDIHLRHTAPWGLVIRQSRHSATCVARVYPNLDEIRRQVIDTRRQRNIEPGAIRRRLRGQGREFESLRDYLPGDQLRHVSWTATARRGRLITRQYEVERNQSIVIMLDAGRLMTSRVGRFSKLDHAIDAALSIAHVAIDCGDAAGLLVFKRQVVSYLPPQKGLSRIENMIESLYNLEPQMVEPSYFRAFQYLSNNCKRRSLVIILTDLVDREASAELLACTSSLLPRHLPLIVAIGDNDLHSMTSQPPLSVADLYRQSVAEDLLQQREEALARIVDSGGLALDLPAGSISSPLIDQYLAVKERGVL